MAATYKIHPSIGLARVGNSPNEFYIAPETVASLPIACGADGVPVRNPDGTEQTTSAFKDEQGRIKRQAARFQVFVYDDTTPDGREVQIGDKLQFFNKGKGNGQLIVGEVTDIEWSVYLANKKSNWYTFQQTDGEHGYAPNHPLRNAGITDVQARQKLIIDPGSRSVSYTNPKHRTAQFSRATMGSIGSFPPPLQPNSIDTLGDLLVTQDQQHNRLLVLGGHGNSGSMSSDFGTPMTQDYANNDGWFDDISDGPVKASLVYKVISIDGHAPVAPNEPTTGKTAVDDPAWVIVGYPRFAPQLTDLITLDELLFDLSVRNFAFDPWLYGVPPYDAASNTPVGKEQLQWWQQAAQWNENYYPYFQRDIAPLLNRANNYQLVMSYDGFYGADPHENAPGSGGNFDPDIIGVAPYAGEDPVLRESRRSQRQFIYSILRQPGQDNRWVLDPDANPSNLQYLMPMLCGDNPISNTAPAKFLHLTRTQIFLLKQWADGKFVNESVEGIQAPPRARTKGQALDQGVLSAGLGGAFCPGGETGWIIRNPAIYSAPYRIHHAKNVSTGSLSQPAFLNSETPADLASGLEPGDMTKYSGVPWQADFNECSNQTIDTTYEGWNVIYLSSTGDPGPAQPPYTTYWWPVHRPMYVNNKPWSPTPQTNAGDTMMVSVWSSLSFLTFQADGSFGPTS